jgi:hypothetical protein
MEKSIWIERLKNGVLHRGKEETNSLFAIQRGKANWVGHILRRNCDIKYRYWSKDRMGGKTRKKT